MVSVELVFENKVQEFCNFVSSKAVFFHKGLKPFKKNLTKHVSRAP